MWPKSLYQAAANGLTTMKYCPIVLFAYIGMFSFIVMLCSLLAQGFLYVKIGISKDIELRIFGGKRKHEEVFSV